ncbi:uncharacterized protein LOC126747745 [Anthonomus grandis grandis]|uniref:uncharacterized protein LOC126747745 n=1 Tax=Anthonomus grandis grandis TaxID=2921223 RepID=UPI0021655FB7|nr:uncharacterized protein LOC126747745 [Anthonomus grandis grandis]
MKVYWKALFGYGFVFWIILCLTDLLGVTHLNKYKENLDDLYEQPWAMQHLENKLDGFHYGGMQFGWSLLLWNTLTFIISMLVCSFIRSSVLLFRSLCKSYKAPEVPPLNQYENKSLSKIPVLVNKALTRNSDTTLLPLRTNYSKELSCPNLLCRASGSSASVSTCRTLFRKDIYFCAPSGLSQEDQLEKQCKRLKQELHRLQTVSLKEHAILSRKLEAIVKERNELSRQFSVSKKENRAAKQQLEELLLEKGQLLKKLENAAKEFKSNTKTKKLALAKLEEVSGTAEELRQQLEQVSRDKEILDKKLKLLESEYNKLHERFIASQQKLYDEENLPERDENCVKPAKVLASVSQTEVDMRNIQEKIKRLEKNLENLNCGSVDLLASELSLSFDNNSASDSQNKHSSWTNYSLLSSGSTPRQTGYWSDKVADLISRNKRQFAKIHELAVKMQEKTGWLGGRPEEEEEVEVSSDSEDAEPKRMVSSSLAFKNFLKSLNKLDAAKKEQPSSNSEVYF